MHRLQPGPTAVGAAWDLAVFLPLVIALAVLHRHGLARDDVYVLVTSALAAFIAPVVGGFIAAQRAGDAQLLHGAAAAGVAAGIYVAFRVVDGIVTGRSVIAGELVILIQLTVAMGVLGGYLARRGRSS
jgi:putative membrane protein (TIGR04086 family)